MSTGNSKVVFVGNVPYNMTEEQLVRIFKQVGQVVGFRLAFDRDTAKPKGYGFCEFADHETALSAVRNLNNTECGGRPLRVGIADLDPFLEGKTTVRGEVLDGGYCGPSEPRSQWRAGQGGGGGRQNEPDAFLASIPTGKPVRKDASLDSISETLAGLSQPQLMEVLAQMKSFVVNHPQHARTLLLKHPQLSYALFQALLLNNIGDSAIMERMLASSRGTADPIPQASLSTIPPPSTPIGSRPPMSALLAHLQHHVPPPTYQYRKEMPPFPPQGLQPPQPMQAMSMPPAMPPMPPAMLSTPPAFEMFLHLQSQTQQQQQWQQQQSLPPPISAGGGVGGAPQFYRPPPPPPVQRPPVVQPQLVQPKPPAAPPEISDAQRRMLMQVLSMPQEQIDGLAET